MAYYDYDLDRVTFNASNNRSYPRKYSVIQIFNKNINVKKKDNNN